LKVAKFKGGLQRCPIEDVVTTRAFPSGDVLAVDVNKGSSNFVK